LVEGDLMGWQKKLPAKKRAWVRGKLSFSEGKRGEKIGEALGLLKGYLRASGKKFRVPRLCRRMCNKTPGHHEIFAQRQSRTWGKILRRTPLVEDKNVFLKKEFFGEGVPPFTGAERGVHCRLGYKREQGTHLPRIRPDK